MLNHISIGCTDLAAATAFYDGVLAPLGYVRVCSGKSYSGYNLPETSDDLFSLKLVAATPTSSNGFHVAFTATSRSAVDRFHAAALALGAEDDGAPALRPQYGPNYYAAFVIDPSGYAIEAVCHGEN